MRLYLRHSPLERGKYRMRTLAASRFLVARWPAGPWVRVSGLSGFEWDVFNGEQKEVRTLSVFRTLIRPGMTVFDVGANIGYFSLTAARIVGPTGQVHAFEPTPQLIGRLEQNARLNNVSNVAVTHCAVGDVDSVVSFVLEEDSEANHVAGSADHGSVMVEMTTLDRYVTAREIPSVDLIKIDCEGAEERVIRGARRVLSTRPGPLLILEMNAGTLRRAGSTPRALVEVLAGQGYICYELEQLRRAPTPVSNVLAFKHGVGDGDAVVRDFELRPYRPPQ